MGVNIHGTTALPGEVAEARHVTFLHPQAKKFIAQPAVGGPAGNEVDKIHFKSCAFSVWGVMMRSVVLGAVSAMTLIAAASAADMYVPAPASTGSYKDEPIFATWTGFYLGVNGGYGWQNNIDIDVKTFPTSGGAGVYNSYEIKSNLSGGFGGGEIGYNFQRNNIVFGVEADIQGSDLKDSGTSRFLVGPNQVLVTLGSSIDVNWFGSVRGRLGYAFDRTLVYATGGFAFGGVDAGYSYLDNGGSGKGSKSDILTGYAVGGGIEH